MAAKLLKWLSLINNLTQLLQKNTYILWRCPLTKRDLSQLNPRTPYVLTQLLIPVTSTSTKVYKTYLWSPYHLTPTTAPPCVVTQSCPEQPQLTMGKGRLISWARCILGSLVRLLSPCIPLLWGRGMCEFWIWGKCLTIDQGSLVRSRDKLSCCCLLTKCWQWVSGSEYGSSSFFHIVEEGGRFKICSSVLPPVMHPVPMWSGKIVVQMETIGTEDKTFPQKRLNSNEFCGQCWNFASDFGKIKNCSKYLLGERNSDFSLNWTGAFQGKHENVD